MSRCENEDPTCCEALVEPARTDVATKTKVIRATERIPKARTYVLRDRVLIHHAFYRLRGKRSRQFCGFFEVICQMPPYKHLRREFPENPLPLRGTNIQHLMLRAFGHPTERGAAQRQLFWHDAVRKNRRLHPADSIAAWMS